MVNFLNVGRVETNLKKCEMKLFYAMHILGVESIVINFEGI